MNIELEELRAWVDGELGKQRSAIVADIVNGDPELQQTVAKLKASKLPYKEAYEQLSKVELPDSLQEQLSVNLTSSATTSRAPLLKTAMAASVLMSLLAGYFIGSHSSEPETPATFAANADVSGFAETVAAYQSLYARETVSNIKNGKDKLPELSARLIDQASLEIQVPDLQAQGYTFVRAQQLEFNNNPLVQLIYLAEQGLPLALCFMREEGSETPVAINTHFGLNSAEWRDQNRRFVIVSDNTEKALVELYQATKAQWES